MPCVTPRPRPGGERIKEPAPYRLDYIRAGDTAVRDGYKKTEPKFLACHSISALIGGLNG